MKIKCLQNQGKRMLAAVLTAVMIATPVTQTAFASSKISSLKINLDIDLVVGESLPNLEPGFTDDHGPEVKIPEDRHYTIRDIEWSNEVDEVEMGKSYGLKVTLVALDDYEFKNLYTSEKVKVRGGSFVSARLDETSNRLIVTLKTEKAEGTFSAPDELEWKSTKAQNDRFGYAAWDKVGNASYDVDLLRGGKVIHRVDSTKKTTFNFYPYMTKEGDYSFRVRAVPANKAMESYATKSEWSYSDEMYVDEDEVYSGTSQEVQKQETAEDNTPNITTPDQVGWIESRGKWFFRYPDGTYLRNSWGKIGGVWYLFHSNGEMLTGWHKRNGYYYYMNFSGAMHTGWLLENDIWYYLNPDGSLQTGWLTVNGATYYMDENGAMQTGWEEIGGQYYYFYPDGHKAVNEVIDEFYVDHNGVWHRP